MISVAPVMVVEPLPFLMAVSLQECRIQIQKNVFRWPDRVDLPAQDMKNLLELDEGSLIHAVEETRHSRLGSKGILAQDCTEHRIIGKFIRIIVIEVTGNDLIDPLHKVLIVCMEKKNSRVICLEVVLDDFFKTDAMCEFLKEKQAAIRRKFAAIEVKFELLIES